MSAEAVGALVEAAATPGHRGGRGRVSRPDGAGRRVAILSTWHPEPADNGRKQRTRRMIEALAVEYEVILISLVPPEERGAALPRVPGVSSQHILPLPAFRPRSPGALAAALGPMPRSLAATWDGDTATALAAIARREGVDLAIGTDLRTLRYLTALGNGIRTILDEPDVSPFVAAPDERARGFAGLRMLARERKYRRFLRGAAARLDAVVVASPEEAHAYAVLSGTTGAIVLENGVAAIPRVPWEPPHSGRLIYTGALGYGPNAEAIAHFVRATLPQIAAAIPGVQLDVTGAIPAVAPPEARDPRVTLTGRLGEADFDARLRGADACVIPLLRGTGTRIKLLEALALGMPVVSTRKGAEGLHLRDGEHLLLADDPTGFAAATIRVLLDDTFASTLGARGREAIRARYDWGAIGGRLRALVRELLDGTCPPVRVPAAGVRAGVA